MTVSVSQTQTQTQHRLFSGGRINRRVPLNFSFNGKTYQGFQGDTLASALLANGVVLVGRSFKYHRPRGIVSAGLEEFNALVQLESGNFHEPNVRATQVELYEGLCARSQNVWPSVSFDLRSVTGLFAGFLPAGFYYKTFIAPSWGWWEGIIRKAAGLGTVPKSVDPERYSEQNMHCDCLVVGAGPAGLKAALAAAEAGKRVILADDQATPGGSILWQQSSDDTDNSEQQWLQDTLARLQQMDNVQLLSRCLVFGYYDHNVVAACERISNHLGPTNNSADAEERLWRIRAHDVVLATGAIERPLSFVDNDRPGIMLAASVRHYINRYAVLPNEQAVVLTNNNSAYHTALALKRVGAEVVIVDTRAHPSGPAVDLARTQDIVIYAGHTIVKVQGSRGLKSVDIASLALKQKPKKAQLTRLNCSLVAMSGGWNPSVHLFSQSGGKLRYDDGLCCFVPDQAVQKTTCVGAANGDFGEDYSESAIEPIWQTPHQRVDKQWIDFQYDITIADIEQAARENFISVEHFKRYTGTGMCVDQGKTGNVSALAVLAEATGRKIPQVGTTKFRPPYHPVSIGTMVGQSFGEFYAPTKQMPAHEWHRANGAVFEDASGWQRPSYYLQQGETSEQAIGREALAARKAAGLFEGSPLGKIEVRGKDATDFLNRIYMNNMATLKPGKVRYGLMLNENGVIMDDGVLACFSETHYHICTTSAGARTILLWLEEWLQCEWPHLDVQIASVTQQWAVCTLSGPEARTILEKLPSDMDLSAESFPHMAVKEGVLAGVVAKIFRVSFTGELSYEINVPADYGLSLWEALMALGKESGITAIGLEALEVLRTEKGYLHLGSDTDGTSCPDDVGWGVPASKKVADYIGKRSLSRAANTAPDRLQFVGLSVEGTVPLPIGGHLIEPQGGSLQMPIETQGYVTSSQYSPSLGRCVALGALKAGRQRMGDKLSVYNAGKIIEAEVVDPVFYDQKGARLNA